MKFIVSLFFVASITVSAHAQSAKTIQAKLLVTTVAGSFDNCAMNRKQADLLYRTDQMQKYQAKLSELMKCIDAGPEMVMKDARKMRATLSANSPAEAELKNFIAFYRDLISRLPTASVIEADKYSELVRAKGQRFVSEIDW